MTGAVAAPFVAEVGPALGRVIDTVLAAWPDHLKFLTASFRDRSPTLLETSEDIADLLCRVAAALDRPLSAYADDYRYLCEEIVFPEELFFRRNGRYRLATFAQADAEVYANAPLMARYMNGLFVSDSLWFNHASAMNDFARRHLPALPKGGRHLEIGPGHGMLLHLALRYGDFASLTAWDVSQTSIDHAGEVLAILGERERVDLRLQDLYAAEARAANAGAFDAIVLSEVLEHLERPGEALAIIRELLAPGGTVWINVPANGPAPDHLYLLRNPAEARAAVAAAGLEVVAEHAFALAGSNLDRAIRQELPISCCITARRPG